LTDAAFHSDRSGSPVGEGACRIMARAASNRAIDRQASVEEEPYTECNLLESL